METSEFIIRSSAIENPFRFRMVHAGRWYISDGERVILLIHQTDTLWAAYHRDGAATGKTRRAALSHIGFDFPAGTENGMFIFSQAVS